MQIGLLIEKSRDEAMVCNWMIQVLSKKYLFPTQAPTPSWICRTIATANRQQSTKFHWCWQGNTAGTFCLNFFGCGVLNLLWTHRTPQGYLQLLAANCCSLEFRTEFWGESLALYYVPRQYMVWKSERDDKIWNYSYCRICEAQPRKFQHFCNISSMFCLALFLIK